MSYTIGDIRRWDTGALITAATEVTARHVTAEEACRALSEGRDKLDDGWDGLAADAVLDATETEKRHVIKLSDGLEDLADELSRAGAALGPAVQTVRDRIADAECVGLTVGDDSVGPAAGRNDAEQSVADQHAEAIFQAIDTVRSLDEHYGHRIDAIASQLHHAIPPEVDRSPIPGPDDPWPGRGVEAMTGGIGVALAAEADAIDPKIRAAHARASLDDAVASRTAGSLRGVGRVMGPLGTALTVHAEAEKVAEGSATAPLAGLRASGALGGGALGGMASGAVAGSFVGPVGTFVMAGLGAIGGSAGGQYIGEKFHEAFTAEDRFENVGISGQIYDDIKSLIEERRNDVD